MPTMTKEEDLKKAQILRIKKTRRMTNEEISREIGGTTLGSVQRWLTKGTLQADPASRKLIEIWIGRNAQYLNK